MPDKILKKERRMNPGYKIQRVASHGYGKNDRYRNKTKAVCYSTLVEGQYHSFVSYEKSNFGKFIAQLRWKIRYRINILKNFFKKLKGFRIRYRLPTRTKSIQKSFFKVRGRYPTEEEIQYYKQVHKKWNWGM